eukprot:10922680-Heterocapsa_arctica.AAC.1
MMDLQALDADDEFEWVVLDFADAFWARAPAGVRTPILRRALPRRVPGLPARCPRLARRAPGLVQNGRAPHEAGAVHVPTVRSSDAVLRRRPDHLHARPAAQP